MAAAIVDGLGDRVDDDVRTMVLGAVLAGDERDAIISAAALAVEGHAAAVAERLGADPSVDLTALVAARAEQPVARIVGAFDDARALARWTGPWTALVGVLLAGGGAAGLLALVGWRRALAWWTAAALVGAGAVVLVGWLVVRSAIASPLEVATSTGPDGWRLPPATALLVTDVSRAVKAQVSATVWRCSAVLALVAVGLVAGSAVAGAVRDVSARRWAYVGVAALALLAVSAVVGSQPDEELACNGHVELCDRPYDEVTYAATHNSMSSPDVVPVWPEHDGGLTEQLDAGVRALLIDTHHWLPVESAQQLVDVGQRAEPTIPPALAGALLDQIVTVRDGATGHVPLPHPLRVRRPAAGGGLAEVTRVPRRQPARGRHADHPGRHLAGGDGGRVRRRRPHALRARPRRRTQPGRRSAS